MSGNTADWGGDLTSNDLAGLEARWITPELARHCGIRRVDSLTGAEMFGRNGHGKDMSGIIIPNIFPGETQPREFRIRLDHPDVEYRADGTKREIGKYLSPPQRPPMAFFPVGIQPEALENPHIPLIITEGEFKAIALWRLALYGGRGLRFVPVGLQGVDSWRGTVGKTQNSSGRRISIKGMLPDLAARINWKGRRVIIAYDADATTSDRVERARARLMYALIELGASVGWIEWPATEGKGIDDRLAQVGPERVLFDIANCEFGSWQSQMVRTKEGALVACIENVRLFLSNAAEWVGAVGYNEFTGTHVIIRDDNPTTFHTGQEIEDHYDTQVICWLERRHLFTNPATVGRVIDSVAREHAYHPVRHYLESLPAWDGRPRIGSWLLEYCGAEAEDEGMYHYIATIGEKFLISAVARIFEPGCKVDHLLILEGTQGIGKSTVPRILAGDEWFTDQLADLGHKQDAAMALRGRWVIEFGELDVIGRAEMTRVNAFLTQQTDRYRPPYGRHMVEFPRQCVFIGTTNQDAWSRDETGARRFWPVRCGVIDVDGLKRDREQLWAEAIRQYRAGVKWWLEGRDLLREAVNQQEGRYLGDPWQERVIEHAENLADCVISGSRANSASISEILDKLGIRVGDQDQRMANRVARCLLFAKWVRKRTGSRGDREWRYFRPVMTQAIGAVV